jgi:hypothetical protein
MNLLPGFIEFTREQFSYLENDFGFTLVSSESPFVIYDSNELRVYVYFDAERTHELDSSIERLIDVGKRVPSLGISELIALQTGGSETYRSPYPSTVEELRIEVSRLATLLKVHGAKLFRGGPSEWQKISRLRREREKEILDKMRSMPESRTE